MGGKRFSSETINPISQYGPLFRLHIARRSTELACSIRASTRIILLYRKAHQKIGSTRANGGKNHKGIVTAQPIANTIPILTAFQAPRLHTLLPILLSSGY